MSAVSIITILVDESAVVIHSVSHRDHQTSAPLEFLFLSVGGHMEYQAYRPNVYTSYAVSCCLLCSKVHVQES